MANGHFGEPGLLAGIKVEQHLAVASVKPSPFDSLLNGWNQIQEPKTLAYRRLSYS